MAQRGTPLPFALRQAIKELRASGTPVRRAAKIVGVDKETVVKYGKTSTVQNDSRKAGSG